VTDLHKARREHVEQKAANEGVDRQGDAAATLGGKAHPVGVDGLQALIGETHAMGVAAEVTKDLLRGRRSGSRLDMGLSVGRGRR
jgi:hypothetical protein